MSMTATSLFSAASTIDASRPALVDAVGKLEASFNKQSCCLFPPSTSRALVLPERFLTTKIWLSGILPVCSALNSVYTLGTNVSLHSPMQLTGFFLPSHLCFTIPLCQCRIQPQLLHKSKGYQLVVLMVLIFEVGCVQLSKGRGSIGKIINFIFCSKHHF